MEFYPCFNPYLWFINPHIYKDLAKDFSERFMEPWTMGFAFMVIQLWSIPVDILRGQVSVADFPARMACTSFWNAVYLSPPGCLTAFWAGQSFITVSSGSDSFLFSVLTELSFITLTSYLALQWFMCMSYFLYYLVRAVLDSFPTVLTLCLAHSRSSIYF